jgi:hypothetical protein
VLATEARDDCALKVLDHVPQAPELVGKPLVLGDLILDLEGAGVVCSVHGAPGALEAWARWR